MLNLQKLFQRRFIIKSAQLLQLRHIFFIPGPNLFSDKVCQRMIAVQKPPPESYAIRLIVEFLRIQLIKFLQLRVL